jgi:hypothetical protein
MMKVMTRQKRKEARAREQQDRRTVSSIAFLLFEQSANRSKQTTKSLLGEKEQTARYADDGQLRFRQHLR